MLKIILGKLNNKNKFEKTFFFSDIRAKLEIAIENLIQTVRINSINNNENSSDNEEVWIKLLFFFEFIFNEIFIS